MHPTSPRRALAALFAAALLLAACGDDDAETATASGDAAGQSDMDDGHDHDHGAGHEVGGLDEVPTVSATVEADAKSGANVQIETTGFTFTPESASTEYVEPDTGPVQGHAHVYVDGEKVGRVYTDWYHLDGLEPGEHEVKIELNADDHAPYLVDGAPVAETVTVEIPEHDGAHSHGGDGFEASEPIPTVSVEAIEDPMSGWNVHVTTTDFTFTPEKVNEMETVSGEGHAHLYVDGQKLSRLYGDWYHVGAELEPGEHQLRVELNANDHVAYVTPDGMPIEATTTITVEGDVDEEPTGDEGEVVEVDVAAGEVTGGGRVPVELGSTVTIRVTSDQADHIHLHGYDVMVDVPAGETADLTFDATIPGVFEVELEDSRIQLLELEIS